MAGNSLLFSLLQTCFNYNFYFQVTIQSVRYFPSLCRILIHLLLQIDNVSTTQSRNSSCWKENSPPSRSQAENAVVASPSRSMSPKNPVLVILNLVYLGFCCLKTTRIFLKSFSGGFKIVTDASASKPRRWIRIPSFKPDADVISIVAHHLMPINFKVRKIKPPRILNFCRIFILIFYLY